MCSILELILETNAYGEKALTGTQEKACAKMMLQVNECATFINTYIEQSYGVDLF
jgi:hypothetical protein